MYDQVLRGLWSKLFKIIPLWIVKVTHLKEILTKISSQGYYLRIPSTITHLCVLGIFKWRMILNTLCHVMFKELYLLETYSFTNHTYSKRQ